MLLLGSCSTNGVYRLLVGHRNEKPDGPYAVQYCSHLNDGVRLHPNRRVTWDCAPTKVQQLNREHNALVAYLNALAYRPSLVNRWSGVARCDSGGNWSINTGNGFYGGLQFSLSTWRGQGGQGMPHQQPAWYQAKIADRLRISSGLHHWPHCSKYYG